LISGVCDSTSPVKAKVIACGSATLDAVVTGSVIVATEVVEVQPDVMQANTKINRPRFTQPIYCSAITTACSC
jgi:hypothetical protein